MSWLVIEGRFDGISEQKTLQNGTELATFKLTEEARGAQEATTFSVTGFAQVAQAAQQIKVGSSVAVKCKLKSRTYKDKNGGDRMATEINAFGIYVSPLTAGVIPAVKASQDFAEIPF